MMGMTEERVFWIVWHTFRDTVGRLSVRTKTRPSHWQSHLAPTMLRVLAVAAQDPDVADPVLIERVITKMAEGAPDWCMNSKLDEIKAQAALRRAIHTIFEAHRSERPKESAGTDGGTPSRSPAEVTRYMAELEASVR